MTVGFRNSAGVDFDSLFDPYVVGTPPANCGFRSSAGVDLAGRYAPIAFGTKGPNVGFRTSAALDLSNLWAAAGTADYSQAFNGGSYISAGTALTGQTAAQVCSLTLSMKSDGTWEILRIRNGFGAGTVVVTSGTWLLPGEVVSDYEVQYVITPTGSVTVSNGASAYSALTSTRNGQVTATNPVPASATTIIGSATVTCNLRKIGAGSPYSVSTCTFNCSATGYL